MCNSVNYICNFAALDKNKKNHKKKNNKKMKKKTVVGPTHGPTTCVQQTAACCPACLLHVSPPTWAAAATVHVGERPPASRARTGRLPIQRYLPGPRVSTVNDLDLLIIQKTFGIIVKETQMSGKTMYIHFLKLECLD